MTRSPKNILIKSAAVLACCSGLSALAAPEGPAQPGRLLVPVLLHNEQGDIAPMSEPRQGCRTGAPWFGSIGFLPNGWESDAIGISADGQYVVGYSTGEDAANGAISYLHAIAWNACNGIRSLPGTPSHASWSTAYSISNTGRHVAGMVGMNHDVAGLWTSTTDGVIGLSNPELGVLQRTIAKSVSSDGTMFAGTAEDANGTEAFMYTLGEPRAVMLGDLPGGSHWSDANAISHYGNAVVGRGTSAEGQEAFLWRAGVGMIGLGDLPGGAFGSTALAVNSDGTVVVGWAMGPNGREAFRWTEETGMVGLGDLAGGGFDSEAFAVSADGNVVVGRATSASGDEAFIWTPETGMRSLRQVALNQLPPHFAAWTLTVARGISADGMIIVGSGYNAEGLSEGWVLELPRGCRGDWNSDGQLNTADLFDFLSAFFGGEADFSGDNQTNTQDFFEFLSVFFAGC